jgi:DNA polymerase elongation subunit (family B)
MSKVNIVAFDIETLPMIVPTWQLFKANIRPESIIEHTSVFCASWQTVDHNGNPKQAVQAVSVLDDPKRFDKNLYDDEHVIRELHRAVKDADLYLYQNGDRFDLKKLNARIAFYGLEPLAHKQSIDTLKKTKQVMSLDSHKLGYMGLYFGVGEKLHTGGQEMWDKIIQGKYPPVGKDADMDLTIKTIKYAVKYCKQDVKLLVDYYKRIRPYIKLPNFSLFLNKTMGCTHCGGQDFKTYGWRYNSAGKYRRYWCHSCVKPFDPPRSQGKWIDGQFEHA